MKKITFIAFLMACFAGNMSADDNVTGVVVGPASSTSWIMHVVLNNDVSYNAFQFDITLPEGFTVNNVTPSSTRLVKGENVTIGGESVETPFVVSTATVDESTNKIRVLGYNLGNNAIQGTSGNTLLKLELTSSTAIEDPTDITDVAFSNVMFVNTTTLVGADLASTAASGALLGDVNYDKTVNTTDAVSIINYYLGTDTTIDVKIADANNDDSVNTTDAVKVINTYLKIKTDSSSAKTSSFDNTDEEETVVF